MLLLGIAQPQEPEEPEESLRRALGDEVHPSNKDIRATSWAQDSQFV